MKIDSLCEVRDILLENDNIIILTHANPDGDTLGSAAALCLALRSIGKKVNISNSDSIPLKYRYLTDTVPDMDFEPNYIMSVDVADTRLLGEVNENKYKDKISLAIDHHGTNKNYAEKEYVEADSASCCEIIYELIKTMSVQITKEMADALFTGCSTDTGCFKYSNVTPRTHIIASELISLGADSARINEVMFDTKTFAQLKLQKLCLDSLELFENGKISLFTITKEMSDECGCEESDFDFIVALARQIEGVNIGITLKEKANGQFKASVRTNGDYDAALFCSYFGGGGHAKAAGCSFDCGLEEARKQLINKAIEIL